ncbi:MAG TPA: hypothetical protein VNM45_14950 [Bacillus sp. (in: firmicutes)]|nr:hypothetical protein [Bacillus sp. (in: firmicutes)]
MSHTEEHTDETLDSFSWDVRNIDAFKELNAGNSLRVQIKYLILFVFLIVLIIFWYIKPFHKLDEHTYAFHKTWLWYSIGFSFILVHFISFFLHKFVSTTIINTYRLNATNLNCIQRSSILFKDLLFNFKFEEAEYDFIELKEQIKHSVRKLKSLKGWFELLISLVKFVLKTLSKFIFTPDYFWAEFYKRRLGLYISKRNTLELEQLEVIRYLKKFYIERSNWINLIVTVTGVLFTIYYLADKPVLQGKYPYFVLIFVSYRILSRTLEIIIAFYNDIVVKRDKIFYKKTDGSIFTINNDIKFAFKDRDETMNDINNSEAIYIYPWKNSLLLPSARTSLALHSLLEITIIFGCLYFLLAGLNHYITDVKEAVPDDLLKKDNTGIVKYFLYSFSIAITLPDIKPATYWAIPQFLQILSSLILVIMSVAYYLGAEHKIREREKELYQGIKEEYIKSKFKNF